MAHELDSKNGKASIAYVGDKPWHGLGQKLEPGADLDTWTTQAGLDWEALVIPSQYKFGDKLITAPNSFHMVRSDNGESLSVMSKRYKPVQPADIMAFYRDLVLVDDRFQLETAGALKGGRIIWALAKFAEDFTVNGDAHKAYMMLTTSFDGTMATQVRGTMIRVVCNNTLSAAVYGGDNAVLKVPHYKDMSKPETRADIASRFGEVIGGFGKYQAMGEALAGIKLARDEVETFFLDLTVNKAAKGDADKEPSGKVRGQLEALLSSYKTTLAEGCAPASGWALLNAVTRYVDHDRISRDTTGDGADAARMASASFGSGAAMKRDALEALKALQPA